MIVDLRDYVLVPGGVDQLVERTERLFFPEQERLGARFLGSFRDADDANRYLFVRGMPDLPTRQRVLTAFYSDGAMWREHRDEVNSWLVDTDNVLLIRPVSEPARPGEGSTMVAMWQHLERQPLLAARGEDLRTRMAAAVDAAGGRLLATFATDPVENNYPRHPIRTGEHGLVWLATFPSRRAVEIEGFSAPRWLLPTPGSRMR
jgi:hypothetical protein